MSSILESVEVGISKATLLPQFVRVGGVGAAEWTYAAAQGLFTSRKTNERIENLIQTNHDMDTRPNRWAVVTGGNNGIGLETCRALAKGGWGVILGSRTKGRGDAAVEDIKQTTGNQNVECYLLDLVNFDSVKSFASQVQQKNVGVQLLINNAGIMDTPFHLDSAKQIEQQMSTNHLGHFYLTHLLLPLLKSSAPSRIINLSSCAHYGADRIDYESLQNQKRYNRIGNYGISKLANVLFTKRLAKLLKDTGVKAYSVHPGVIPTGLYAHRRGSSAAMNMFKKVLPNTVDGSYTTLVAALGQEEENGSYFAQGRKWREGAGVTEEEEEKLWDFSLEVCKIADSQYGARI
ncbi:hypothetical protein HDU85_005249 [Gaertneriomyces sp. JEL0708]|nr:hypothetical protein HDU85_005249 [Gaertneriomyces sp. JEL0708]